MLQQRQQRLRRARRRAPSRRRGARACRRACVPSGRPAESSTSIPQRLSSTATRRASPRSGVTSAATCPAFSAACRRRTATASASSRSFAASTMRDAARAPRAFSRVDRARPLAPALGRAGRAHRFGDEALAAMQRALGALAERLDIARAARRALSSSSFSPYCGWPAPAGSRSLGADLRPRLPRRAPGRGRAAPPRRSAAARSPQAAPPSPAPSRSSRRR